MSRPATHGFQKPLDSGKRKEVGLAVISYIEAGGAMCSCGWGHFHSREKVREDAIDRHINRKHQGRAIRV